MQANDADGPLQGDGRIRYTLESDNSITHKGNVFNIDKDTGEIIIIDKVETMDTPRGQYELVVRATDYGKTIISLFPLLIIIIYLLLI